MLCNQETRCPLPNAIKQDLYNTYIDVCLCLSILNAEAFPKDANILFIYVLLEGRVTITSGTSLTVYLETAAGLNVLSFSFSGLTTLRHIQAVWFTFI